MPAVQCRAEQAGAIGCAARARLPPERCGACLWSDATLKGGFE